MNGIGFWVVYAAFLIGLMYFVAIRPQNKEKKKMAELLASVAVGDTVLTSSGFYGVVIDMTDDTRYSAVSWLGYVYKRQVRQ